MTTITKYNFLLFIVPFITVFIAAYFLDALPKGNIFRSFMDVITEKEMNLLLARNGTSEKVIKLIPYFRIAVCILLALILYLGKKTLLQFIISFIAMIAFYKFFYIYFLMVDSLRIIKLNRELPYLMKTIIYLMQRYNVHDAIEKAYTYSNTVYKYDLKILAEETFRMPRSYEPYQNFVNRYDGKIENLDRYLKSIYRLTTSGSSEEGARYMTNVNETISSAVADARQAKNDTTNKAISYLGFIPVAISTFMIIYMLILSISAI